MVAYVRNRRKANNNPRGARKPFFGNTRNTIRKVALPKKSNKTGYKNARAINSLYRAQKQIKAMTYGSVQTGLHELVNNAQLQLSKDHPYLWDMTDCTRQNTLVTQGGVPVTRNGAHIYSLGIDPVTNAVGTVQNSYWVRQHVNNPYFKELNDIPDTGKYLPLYAEYNIKIKAFNVTRPITVTFHMFVARPQTMTQVGTDLNNKMLPASLPSLTNLADPLESVFPVQYFKLYSKRTVKIYPMHNAQNHEFHKNLKICVKPKGERNQDYTTPVSPLDATGELPAGNFAHLNCPITEPYWCIASTDIPFVAISDSQTNPYVQMNMSRRVVWRDHIGSSNGKIGYIGGKPVGI